MAKLFFSFDGRISRGRYWFGMLIALGPLLLPATLNDLVHLDIIDLPFSFSSPMVVWLAIIWAFVGFYIAAAISGKRLHDRGRRKWWILPLLFFAFLLVPVDEGNMFSKMILSTRSYLLEWDISPAITSSVLYIVLGLFVLSVVIALWMLIELGFLRSTKGLNKYGPDPLAHNNLETQS